MTTLPLDQAVIIRLMPYLLGIVRNEGRPFAIRTMLLASAAAVWLPAFQACSEDCTRMRVEIDWTEDWYNSNVADS